MLFLQTQRTTALTKNSQTNKSNVAIEFRVKLGTFILFCSMLISDQFYEFYVRYVCSEGCIIKNP